MYQQITIVGNVGRDAALKYTSQGVAVADFSVAVSKVSGSGETKTEKTIWFRVSVWRNLAETADKYVKKGMKILVVGEVDYSTYVDKAGLTQVSLEITGRDIKFLSSRSEMQGSNSGDGGSNRGASNDEEMYAPVEERPKPARNASGGGRGKQSAPQSEDDIPF